MITQEKSFRFTGLSPEVSHLLTKLCNATNTACCAGGHCKASRNEYMAAQYQAELEAMKVSIPERRELIAMGVFNGEGSV